MVISRAHTYGKINNNKIIVNIPFPPRKLIRVYNHYATVGYSFIYKQCGAIKGLSLNKKISPPDPILENKLGINYPEHHQPVM